MPYRRIIFATGEVYHVFNRGVARTPIFLGKLGYQRFLDLLNYYRYSTVRLSFSHYHRLGWEEKKEYLDTMRKTPPLVEVWTYCLIPNHYHLLLRQKQDHGIPRLISRLQNGLAKYVNIRHHRVGPLFQSMFKAVRIENERQLLHVSRYIHLNPITSYLVAMEKLSQYPWSSFTAYITEKTSDDKVGFLETGTILHLSNGREKYMQFVLDQADYQRKLGQIKHLVLE